MMAEGERQRKKWTPKTVSVNKQARRNYELVDEIEVGIVLVGTEVKSIREGKMNLQVTPPRPPPLVPDAVADAAAALL